MEKNYIVIDGMLYYNGAEQYKEEEWVLYTNTKNTHGTEANITLKLSGLVCRINPYTTDRFGNDLPNSFAIELPAKLGLFEQKEAINKDFALIEQLRNTYKKLFYEQNIVPEGYFNWERQCYIGCEKEYGLPKPMMNKEA